MNNYDDRASQSNAARIAKRREAGERSPLKTGACLAGWHEGSKPRTRDNAPIKTCAMFEDCPCSCHAQLDELFEMAGKPRELVVNPEYKPVTSAPLFRPTVALPGVLSGDTVEAGVLVSPAPGIVPGETVKQFTETKSGRIQRGQLEYWVKQACDVWVIESAEAAGKFPPCTPVWIANQISTVEGCAPPPLGGINKIFQRWTNMGIAKIEVGPVRFHSYTPEAIEVGMDRMRDKYERSRKGALAF